MAIFYKYYSHLPLEFFNEPTLKITSPIHLNDPFESLLPGDISEYINSLNIKDEINGSYTKEDVIRTLSNTMTDNGVISFSETQRNLLMWAHYADDHKGLCIGYESDDVFFEATKNRLKHYSELRKVNYDTVRHNIFGEIESIKNPALLHYYITTNVMLTKGESWIYEKEHRFIIPTNKADYIRIKKDDLTKNKQLDSYIKNMVNMNMIEICDRDDANSEYITYIPSDSKAGLGSGIVNKFKQAEYYIRANPKSIKKIYFGCRAHSDYMESVKAEISKNSEIDNQVHINKMQLDNKRFELFIPPLEMSKP